MKYVIFGGHKLKGEIRISGNKNSVFPVMAAALLTKEEVVLDNVSRVSDTDILIQLLRKLGVSIKRKGNTVSIKAAELKRTSLPRDLMTKLRGSIVLVGAMLIRMRQVSFYHPGGDVIGQRSINAHLNAFKQIGAVLKRDDLEYNLQIGADFFSKKKELSIFLQEASVTATENLILASVLGSGVVKLKNCTKEPHVVDLCQLLIKMGAKIEGVGSDTLTVTGVKNLRGARFKIGMDFVEVGTFAVAAAVTRGKITMKGVDGTDLDPILIPLERFGIKFDRGINSITAYAPKLKSIPKLQTNIWPGFPTDLMSAAIVLATQSRGVTLCHDWMYESRMFFVDKLISMGANIILADPHRSLVYGPSKLKARLLDTPDIRAGMALVLAALTAKGKSVIRQAELIERGYEDVVGKLRSLGAQIENIT
ncbi:MAG: UDP-N-acetylglucosamine 1-carboxyvinyltransferase [Candidatus Daviesbacteria bacterium]|nr:UDP-N-acetylglucosamine 1-carboxyvinyltransferase [Candidatus Daviesbacteria bacterium]